MNRYRQNLIIAAGMILLSAVLFGIQLLIFHRAQESFYLAVQELAFLPVQVLLVSFVLERILGSREKRERREKTYIIISAFFSEIGTEAIVQLNPHINTLSDVRQRLGIEPAWTDKEFKAAAESLKTVEIKADVRHDVNALYSILTQKKSYLVDMFNNPNLLEHDRFTRMLWAFYHMIDEFESRQREQSLPETDIRHLNVDVERAYALLVEEWVYYMQHLKNAFPYLFSLAVRKNPFGTQNSVVIR